MRDTFEGDDDLLRRYLLGELSEEETERLEPRLLEDDRLLEQVEAVEGDLLAEYTQGELTEEQEREVRRRLIATQEGRARLAMVQSLHKIGQDTNTRQKPQGEVIQMPQVSRRRASWHPTVAALAAALLLTVVGLSVWPQLQGHFGEHPPVEAPVNQIGEAVIRTPTPDPTPPAEAAPGQQTREPAIELPTGVEATPPAEPESKPKPKPEPAVVEVPLRSAQRGGEAEEEILRRVVSRDAEEIVFSVPLRGEEFTSYRAVLEWPDHSNKTFEGLALVSLPSGEGIQFPVPSARVSEGLYTIEVSGISSSGDDELVGEQKFELQKR